MRITKFSLLLVLLAGCYSYRPLTTAAPVPGRQIQLALTDSGTANMAALLGPSTGFVAGRLVSDSAQTYLVSVDETRKRNGSFTDWQGENVSIPRSYVAGIQERQFSASRTAVVGVGAVAILVGLRSALWGTGGVFGGAKPGPTPGPR